MYDASGLVEVEERRAEEEERREDEVGERDGDADRVLRLRLQQRDEPDPRDEEDDDERGERAQRVDVVGSAELPRAPERVERPSRLDDRDRHDEPDEREIRDGEEREPGDEQRDGREHRRPQRDGDREAPRRRPGAGGEHARGGVGGREAGRGRGEDGRPPAGGVSERELVEDEERQAERERRPETPAVEPNRLGDDLSHGARLGRQRLWQRPRHAAHRIPCRASGVHELETHMGRIHTHTRRAGVVVVSLEGEHELYGATELRRRLAALIEKGLALVVDLTDATFLDSSTVSVLLATRKRAREAGVRFAIVLGDDAAEPVRRMFEITRLDSILPVVHDRTLALR